MSVNKWTKKYVAGLGAGTGYLSRTLFKMPYKIAACIKAMHAINVLNIIFLPIHNSLLCFIKYEAL